MIEFVLQRNRSEQAKDSAHSLCKPQQYIIYPLCMKSFALQLNDEVQMTEQRNEPRLQLQSQSED